MAIVSTGTLNITTSYSLIETSNNTTITESATVGLINMPYENGTGTGQINVGVAFSGTLPSGGTQVFDLSRFPKSHLGIETGLCFTSMGVGGEGYTVDHASTNPERGIKGIVVTNTWTVPDSGEWGNEAGSGIPAYDFPYMRIVATGNDGFSGLFNGESGNIKINPHGNWTFTDFVGITPYQDIITNSMFTKFSLIDSGSGVPYNILIVGVTGTG